MSEATYLIGDVFDRLADIADGSVDLVLTSPPFLALRSYLPADHPDKGKEIGSEPTPAEFLDTLLALTAEWRRVLAPHGSIAVELGDTYAGSGGAGGDYNPGGLRDRQDAFSGSARAGRLASYNDQRGNPDGMRDTTFSGANTRSGGGAGWPMDKSLCGIPHLYHLSLAYGRNLLTGQPSPAGQWRVRNVVAWVRPNPPVGALGDKFRPGTSYMTVATVARDRYFDLDAVRTPSSPNSHGGGTWTTQGGDKASTGEIAKTISNPAGAPPLDWWEIPTQPYKGAHYACVDADTEALTPHGWKRHDRLRDGDLIAAWSPDAEAWQFEPATFHRFPFDGDLVTIDKRVTNQRLTPNHRVVYATAKSPTWRVRRADTLTPGCRVPLAAPMLDQGGTGPGEKAAALAGWFCAEGSVESGRWPVIWQSVTANPDKVAEIRALLDGLGADYDERTRNRATFGRPWIEAAFTVRGAIAEWLRQFHKNLPLSAVFGWGEADARALLAALVDGDGHRRPDGRLSFIQKDKAVAEAVQMLAVRLGYRTTLSPRGQDMWTVYMSPGRWSDLRSGLNGKESAVGREHYRGVVWCPSVPTGMWLARRGGQPFVTGNTWPAALCVRPILAMTPQRVCTTCGKPSRRIVDHERTVDDTATPHGKSGGALNSGGPMTTKFAVHRETVGWSTCGHDTWRPGHVLDPFAGSGTTLAVATGHGRDATGIDLDPRNADLARDRIGMFLNVDTPAVPEAS